MTSPVYNYQQEAKLWLPMTAECHDPVNKRTLDLSGNGLHYRFGDGVNVGTYPTKLPSSRGYSFNGSNYLEAITNQTSIITEGTWAVFIKNWSYGLYYLYGHTDAASNVRAVILLNGEEILFYCGNLVNAASINFSKINKDSGLIVGQRTSDGYRRIWANGIVGTPNNIGISIPSASVGLNPFIGSRYGGFIPYVGQILWCGVWDYALSEIQLRDLEARLRRQINDV